MTAPALRVLWVSLTTSVVLLPLLEAIGSRRSVRIVNFSPRSRDKAMLHWVCPAHIWVSTQDGRQYVLCFLRWYWDLKAIDG